MTRQEQANQYAQLCAQLGDTLLKQDELKRAEANIRAAIDQLKVARVTDEAVETPAG